MADIALLSADGDGDGYDGRWAEREVVEFVGKHQ